MKTTYEIVGRVNAKGKFVSDGTTPLPPGPAKAKIATLKAVRKRKAAVKNTNAMGDAVTPSAAQKDEVVSVVALESRKNWVSQFAEARTRHASAVAKKMSAIDETVYGHKAPLKGQ